VGELEFALHEVVTARDQLLVKSLLCGDRQPGKSGNIKIHAEEKVGKHNEQLSFQLSA
jgi:hypothetical protein